MFIRFLGPLWGVVLACTCHPAFGFLLEEEAAVGSITAASERGYDHFRSGVFVAYPGRGHIEFVGTQFSDDFGNDTQHEVEGRLEYGAPTLIAHTNGMLYVWDNAERQLVVSDVFGQGRRVLTKELVEPRLLLVSDDRNVIVFDSRGVFHVRDNGGEYLPIFRIDALSEIPNPTGAAFLSWDTLSVLHGEEGTILNYELRYKGDYVFARQTKPFPLHRQSERQIGSFRHIAANDGTLFVADEHRVYSYVIEEEELIPATPADLYKDIQGLAATYQNIYVLDGNQLRHIRKTIPVDVDLAASPEVSQTALMKLYMYLDRQGLLPSQTLRPKDTYDSLGSYLLEERILIAPEDVVLVAKSGGFFSWLTPTTYKVRDDLSDGLVQFKYWFCRANQEFCGDHPPDDILTKPISRGDAIVVPHLDVKSYLRRKRVSLGKQSIQEYLDRNIVSDTYQTSISPKVVKRFNRELSDLSDEKLMKYRPKVAITLPTESWSVTVNVPVQDYYNSDSEFDGVTSLSEDVTVVSRERFTKQTARSVPSQQEIDCQLLIDSRKSIDSEIQFPGEQVTASGVVGVDVAEVQIGILEKSSQLSKGHMVFNDNGGSAWYQPVGVNLEPESVSSSFVVGAKPAIGEFKSEAHHGTHVAALIGGRQIPCWSGLLPKSKLVLIDVSSRAGIYEEIDKAFLADTKVFNVSQELAIFGEDQEEVTEKIRDRFTRRFEDVVFVVAAGNSSDGGSGLDLNKEGHIPYPAGLGQSANIITVSSTATTAHKGKKYVDLMSVGENVMSATEEAEFGIATGTSQATPLVTAAAAYLADSVAGGQSAADVKARLIATARWRDDYIGKVWGGAFDFTDAVKFHTQTVLHTFAGDSNIYFSVENPKRGTIKVEWGAEFYERDTEEGTGAHADYKQSDILSMRSNGDAAGTHRIVVRDRDGKLRIILDAKLTGTIKAAGLKRYEFGKQAFEGKSDGSLYHPNGIDVSKVKEYVRGMPYGISW